MTEAAAAVDVWAEVIGQPRAVAELKRAAEAAARGERIGMTHAWLITGPPGSGRSTAARSFAAALLLDPDDPGAQAQEAARVNAGTHPDLTVVATEKSIISIDEVRELVSLAQRVPSGGRWRVILVEDADRMAERTSNVLLKAIEEPPERTVWLLCAPSPSDVIATIRSRCRAVSLRIPAAEEVRDLLMRRHDIPEDLALWAASSAQGHIGRARRLALDETARSQRIQALSIPARIHSVGDAVRAAGALVDEAAEAAKERTEERSAAERAALLEQLGVEAGRAVPSALRAQLRQLEDEQKRRATRARHDELDRVLLDLLSLYRDVLLVQIAAGERPINLGAEEQIRQMAAGSHPMTTLERIDAITATREHLRTNAAPLLLMEALLLRLRQD